MAADSTTATSSDDTNSTAQTSNGNATTTTGDDMTTSTGQSLSADEIALYDRQIRLWGAQAQERIRSAHILLVSLRALGTEIAKNLVLAGISSLTIIDDEIVNEEDLGAQYFLREDDVGQPASLIHLPLAKTSF
jgi:ubiquitin-like 1-activating enzyme E1 A